MCGRFTLRLSLEKLIKSLGIEIPEVDVSYNITPTDQVLCLAGQENLEVLRLRWGIEASWAKSSRLINARSESVLSKPTFRRLVQNYRCVVLADGFYEWKRDGTKKQAFYFTLDPLRPFGFAGFYDPERMEVCILTQRASADVAPVHDRMPVILDTPRFREWLSPNRIEQDDLEACLKHSERKFRCVPVSTRVNSPSSKGPENIVPVEST